MKGIISGIIIIIGLFIYCGKDNNTKLNNNKPANTKEYINLPKNFEGKIAFQSNKDGDNEIYLLTKEGEKKLSDNNYEDEYPVFGSCGEWILYQANPKGGNNYGIYMMKADGTGVKQIIDTSNKESEATFYSKELDIIAYTYDDEEVHLYNIKTKEDKVINSLKNKKSILPMWSPVNNYITYTGKRIIGWDVALYKDERQETVFLTDGGKSCRGRWSHKGDRIAFVSNRADGKGDIWIMNADGSKQTRITKDDNFYEYYPAWSPDDNQIVYSSSIDKKKGNWSLWIIDLNTNEKWKIYDSVGQDVFPSWAK